MYQTYLISLLAAMAPSSFYAGKLRALAVCPPSNLVVSSCDYDTIVAASGSNCGLSDFETYFGTSGKVATKYHVEDVCEQILSNQTVEFESILNKGIQFEREYFNGGTLMNAIEPIRDVDPEFMDRLEFVDETVNTNAIVDFPRELLVFQDCDANTAMCCWTADRDSGETVTDNTDVCHVEMNQMPGTQRASRVYKGSAHYPNDEGPVNCHGFTWDGTTDKFKGNLLFEVAVSHGTLNHGYVKGIPGGPMCGCVEQMPKVSTAACTDVAPEITLSFPGSQAMELVNIKVDFKDCGSSDLAAYVASKGGDVSKYLTGSCDGLLTPLHWSGYGVVPPAKAATLVDFDMSPYLDKEVVIQSFEGDRFLWARNNDDIRALKYGLVHVNFKWIISLPTSYPDGYNASSECYTIKHVNNNRLLYALKTYSFRDGLRLLTDSQVSDQFKYYKADYLWRFDQGYCDETQQKICHFIVNCASDRALFALGYKNDHEGFGANTEFNKKFHPKEMWTMTLV